MSDLPTPHDREEVILNAMATGESIECPEPRTRKEIYLKEIYEQGVTNSLNHTTIGDTEYICSCFKKNESDTYDLSIKPDHTLNSSGKCTVCDKEVVKTTIEITGYIKKADGNLRVVFNVKNNVIDYEVVERGIIFSTNGTFTSIEEAKSGMNLSTVDSTNVKKATYASTELNANITDIGNGVYCRSYVTYKDKSNENKTIYTEVLYDVYHGAEVTLERLADTTVVTETETKLYTVFKTSYELIEYEKVETGILISNNGAFTSLEEATNGLKEELADGTNVIKGKYTTAYYAPKVRDKGNTIYVRGYVIYIDENGVTQTKYTEVQYGRYGDGEAPTE